MALDCIIPAAGASSRMGSFKPLLPLGSTTLVEAAVASALGAEASLGQDLRVLLVVGHRGAEVSGRFGALCATGKVLVVENPAWEAGMLGSLQRALPLVAASAFFVLPADMPLVPPRVFAALLEASRGHAGPVFPACRGQLGHPVLIPASLVPAILGLDPGSSLRPFLLGHDPLVLELGLAGVLADLDTPAEYQAFLTMNKSPNEE